MGGPVLLGGAFLRFRISPGSMVRSYWQTAAPIWSEPKGKLYKCTGSPTSVYGRLGRVNAQNLGRRDEGGEVSGAAARIEDA